MKLHFENLCIFFKKRTYTHARTPLPLFVFVRFSMTSPPRLQRTYFLNDPFPISCFAYSQDKLFLKADYFRDSLV